VIDGVLYPGSEPTGQLKGAAVFTDVTHGVVCRIAFGSVDHAINPLLQRSDGFSVTIGPSDAGSGNGSGKASGGSSIMSSLRRSMASGAGGGSPTAAERGALARGAGNWLSHLDFGATRYWTLSEERPDRWTPAAAPLPSDCRFREDLVALHSGDVKGAQEWKKTLEERQRTQAKLRPKLDKVDCS
jgi:hypothetical protein